MFLRLLRRIDHQALGLVSLVALLLGLLFSRALMSIGMMALVVNAVVNADIGRNARRFIRNPALVGLTAIFLLFLISGLYSENMVWLVNRLRMKLPFLVLPFSIAAIPRLDKTTYQRLLYLFFWLVVGFCLHSFVRYLLDFETITYQYREGKVMPTPVEHIRFSLMAAYCVAIGWYLFRQSFSIGWPGERYAVLAATLFLAIYLHVLAVRSGLVSLYLVFAYLLIDYVVRSRRYRLGIAVAALLVTGALLAMRYVPTIKNKVDYTLYSLHLFQQKQGLEVLSDSYRLATVEAGVAIGNAHKWTGVGIGDLRDATVRYLQEHYPTLAPAVYMPQSQYVLVYAALGIFGLLGFVIATLLPLFYRRSYADGPVAVFHLIALLSFVIEQTLETQLGTAFYLLFALMGIWYKQTEPA